MNCFTIMPIDSASQAEGDGSIPGGDTQDLLKPIMVWAVSPLNLNLTIINICVH